jgi:hypothetical protein
MCGDESVGRLPRLRNGGGGTGSGDDEREGPAERRPEVKKGEYGDLNMAG